MHTFDITPTIPSLHHTYIQ